MTYAQWGQKSRTLQKSATSFIMAAIFSCYTFVHVFNRKQYLGLHDRNQAAL